MKKTLLVTAGLFLLLAFTANIKAQEMSTGLDIYSSYIWRGSKFGSGPAFQPYVEFSAGDFALGAWGSVSASTDEALEMDLYASYAFGPVSLTVTDYYFGGDWTSFKTMHYLEPSLGLSAGDFSLTAAYMFLPGTDAMAAVPGSPATVNLTTGVITPAVEGMDAVEATNYGSSGDFYIEAGYSVSSVDLFIGAGTGQYVGADAGKDFNICNLGIGTSKEVEITESFSLPVSGSVILNPTTGGFFITVGISL